MATTSELPPAVVDELALRRLYADELRAINCNGLAKKVELGFDINPRTLAALALGRKLAGLPPPADAPTTFIRDHS